MNDKLIPLSFSMHANPGVYAVLLGSGVSRTAGIPTGWEVILDLCGKIATSTNDDPGEDLVSWYTAKFGKPPVYDEVIQYLANTTEERKGILRPYFEPTATEREQGKKEPTVAHRAIAELAKDGYIRLILSTNFDQLMENALRAAGVTFQIAYTSDMLHGLTPLVHANCTLVKLHGDYLDTRMRNVTDELATYDVEMDRFLDQAFDQFGLIVAGWSAEYDKALCDAISRCPSRRYSWYWLTIGNVRPSAAALIENRGMTVIHDAGSDSFFTQIRHQVAGFQRLQNTRHTADPDLSIAIVKNMLTREQDIDLHDYLFDAAMQVRNSSFSAATDVPARQAPQEIQDSLLRYKELSHPLFGPIANVAYFSRKENHVTLIAQVLQLLTDGMPVTGGIVELIGLRYMPALLCLYAAGIVYTYRSDMAPIQALLALKGPSQDWLIADEQSILKHLNAHEVFRGTFSYIPQTTPNRTVTPGNQFVRTTLRPLFQTLIPSERDYEKAFHAFEFICGLWYTNLTQWLIPSESMGFYTPRDVNSFLESGAQLGDSWPIIHILFDGHLGHFRDALTRYEQLTNEQRTAWERQGAGRHLPHVRWTTYFNPTTSE